MENNELPALRAGVTSFAGAVQEVADRAECTPTYVTRVLKGLTGRTTTTLLVVKMAKTVYLERLAAASQYKGLFAEATC